MSAHPSLARVFQSWDEDKSGNLSRDEIQRAFGMLNVHLNELEMDAIFLFFDRDGSGEVSSKEFLDAIRKSEAKHVLGEGGMLPGQQASVSDVSTEEDKFKRKMMTMFELTNCRKQCTFFGKSFEWQRRRSYMLYYASMMLIMMVISIVTNFEASFLCLVYL